MYVKIWFSSCLLFVKTHYYSNKQLILHGKVDHNILVMKLIAITIYKDDVDLDIAQKEHEI